MRTAIGKRGLIASSGDRDDLKVQRDVELVGQKYYSTKSSVLRAFCNGWMKANKAFLKSRVIRVVARNIRGGCKFVMVIWSNKVSTDTLGKTLAFFYRCVLKASRTVNTFRPNRHLL